jgi:hypothetical protein
MGYVDPLTGYEEGIPVSIIRIEEEIRSSKRRLEFKGRETLETVLSSLGQASDEVEKLLNYVHLAQDILEKMQIRSVEIEEDTPAATAATEIQTQANKCIETLGDINDSLKEAAEAEQKGAGAQAEDLRTKAWKAYAGKMDESQRVFAEYVDFLRGLAMRDTGLDEGICQIADELLGKWKILDVGYSLTIPARQEALTMTLARIVRLGFPEWTIWALPLAAHELGHVVVSSPTKLKQFVEEKAPDEQARYHLQEFLADACATLVMGPAYAYAAILLRFNPLTAYVEDTYEHPADAKRAYIVFTVLNWMNDRAHETQPYRGIIQTLEKEWNAALKQAGWSETQALQGQEQLEGWVASLKERKLMGEVAVAYPVTSWDRAQGLQKQLLQNRDADFQVSGTYDLRDVLNAAWLCRIQEPAKVESIDQAARAVWNKIVESRKPGGKPTPPGWTGRGG